MRRTAAEVLLAARAPLAAAGLLTALAYPLLRQHVYDEFIWIALAPLASLLYVPDLVRRRREFHLLDWLLIAYVWYGGLSAFWGLANGAPLRLEAQAFVHYYFPLGLYLLARFAGPRLDRTVLAVLLAYAAAFIVDPGIASGVKRPGIVAVLLLVALMPLVRTRPAAIPVLLPLLLALAVTPALRTSNDTAALIVPLVLLLGTALLLRTAPRVAVTPCAFFDKISPGQHSRAAGATLLLLIMLFAGFTHGAYRTIVVNEFLTEAPYATGTQTPFSYTADLRGIKRTVTMGGPREVALGAKASRTRGAENGSSPTSIEGTSELRVFLFPAYFGVGWMAVVLAGIVTATAMAWRVRYAAAGVSVLLLALLVAGDAHYPQGLFHGPFETIIVLVALLARRYQAHRER